MPLELIGKRCLLIGFAALLLISAVDVVRM